MLQSFFSSILVATLLFSPVTFSAPNTPSTAKSVPAELKAPPTKDEIEKLKKDMAAVTAKAKSIKEAKDPKVVTAVIIELQQYPYKEVLEYVLNLLDGELQKEKPNSFVVVECLNTIEAMITTEQAPRLTEIIKKYESSALNREDSKTSRKIEDAFSLALNSSEINPKLASLRQGTTQSFEDLLNTHANDLSDKLRATMASILLTGTKEFMTDSVQKHLNQGTLVDIIGRDQETDRAIDVLVRLKGKNPMFIGIPGVGKTAAADRMAQIIVKGEYPKTEVFQKAFDNAVMIQATPAKISRLAKSNDPNSMAEAVEKFFDAVLYYEEYFAKEGNRKPIFIFIDEFHTLTDSQVEALLPYMDSRDRGISVFGASNSDKFQNKFKSNEALLRRVVQVGLEEFNEAMTIKVLKASWIPVIEAKYNVKFTEHAIETAVKVAPVVEPDTARPDGPFKVLQDVAIRAHRENKGNATEVGDGLIYNHAKDITGLPVNPHDGKAFKAYLEQKEKEINDVVVQQAAIVRKLMERVGNLLIGEPKRPEVIGVIGTTGTGKTLLAETMAEKVYGSKRKALIIDGNDFQTGGLSLNTLFGAPNGVISSDKRSGTLPEFLDDPSRGKMGGVIVINEAEKMHPDGWKKLMEFFDKGSLTGGDGKIRRANRHIVIMTSNRGAKVVFPDNITMWSQKEIDRRLEGFSSRDIAALFRQKTKGDDDFELPPEVLNRIDEWTIANPGSHEGAVIVGQREAAKFKAEMKSLYRIDVDIDPAAVEHLSLTGFSVTEGYRLVAKQITSYLKLVMRESRAAWDVERDGSIKVGVVKNEDSTDVKLVITNSKTNKTLTVRAPEQKFYNPLQDKEIAEKIKNMPKKMSGRIIGQDAAVQSVADAVLAKYADVGRKTAVSFAIIGPTGVGKTELGKAIAEALFGSAERVEIIPLGDVNFEGKLNDIFNAPAGYVDSKKIGKFEQALMNTPNGGVIVFDEFSNMGGGNKAIKEALLKQYFYSILDEGTWTSGATGKVYDLRHHIFEFTGNDMQEHFTGLNTDKARLDTYEDLNKKVKIRASLVENGIPEAFLGRLADTILAKPLLSVEAKAVTEKELQNQIRRLSEQHKNLKVEYDAKFVEDFTRGFFSADTGGRSVRLALDNRLGSLIGGALMETGDIGHDLSAYTFKLHIDDNLHDKPYATTHTPKRKILLGVAAYKGGKRVGFIEKDFTEFAPEVEIPLASQARTTAYHEAGHAVINDPELTGQILDFITIRQARLKMGNGKMITALGYASYKPVPGADKSLNFTKTIAMLAKSYAGQVAQQLAGLDADTGWSSDLEHMRLITTKFLTTWGMDNELVGLALDEKGNPIMTAKQRAIFETKQNELFELAREVAEQSLKEKWVLVRGIVAELLRKGDINQARAAELAIQIKKKLDEETAIRKKGKVQGPRPIISYDEANARLQKAHSELINMNVKPNCDSWLLATIKKTQADLAAKKKSAAPTDQSSKE